MKESESSALADSKSMGGELADMRLELERLRYEGKEQAITTDSLKEQNAELERELEDLRVSGSASLKTCADTLTKRAPRSEHFRIRSRRRNQWSRMARTRRRRSGWPL